MRETVPLLHVAAGTATGCSLALTARGPGWLVAPGVLAAGLAGAGALARRRGWPHWPTAQPHPLGDSHVALATGLLVAQTGSPVVWVLPTLVAQVPVARAKRRLAATA
ncbi:hypothetical protein SAMN05660690_1380 [Geodermatophilus telluris]|uniref:Uncharacterized protein n=1 Tax=Geodermatophilus telluris TaxID=1190417 RepID=A0A1G6LG55_9ACTN|nr:hypothetical protein [Geodermatophilus telluris]SDC42412.1 hypothetical protein SAMN05660690_1380 [Geodermatophilus telluris]